MLQHSSARRAWRRVAACVLAGIAPLAAAQPAAEAPVVRWQCAAAGEGTMALLPADRLAGIVDRHAGLYAARVAGLVQAGQRIYLLGTGGFESRLGSRAAVASASPAEHEFVSRRHVFQRPTRRTAAGFICLAEGEARRQGLRHTGQDEVLLEAGRSVSLFDPSDPAVMVELSASGRGPMKVGEVAALGGRLGLYAGLTRAGGQGNASVALQAPGGEIVFRRAPAPAGAGGPSIATREPARSAAVETVTARAEPAMTAAQAPAEPLAGRATGQEPAPRPRETAGASRTAAAEPPGADAGGYERAMRQLAARQGGGVRAISELTRVHPSVDALRTALR